MVVIAYKFTVLLACSFFQLLLCSSKIPYFWVPEVVNAELQAAICYVSEQCVLTFLVW